MFTKSEIMFLQNTSKKRQSQHFYSMHLHA
jgi:hypothetical protein